VAAEYVIELPVFVMYVDTFDATVETDASPKNNTLL
jgi:hypothetical protein